MCFLFCCLDIVILRPFSVVDVAAEIYMSLSSIFLHMVRSASSVRMESQYFHSHGVKSPWYRCYSCSHHPSHGTPFSGLVRLLQPVYHWRGELV